MKRITVFNLQIVIPIHEHELPFADEYVIVGPLTEANMTISKTLGYVRSLLQEASKTPNFDVNDQVHVIAPPTVQSLCMITTIMAAFNSVTVWFTDSGVSSFVDLNGFTGEGHDFSMSNFFVNNHIQKEK